MNVTTDFIKRPVLLSLAALLWLSVSACSSTSVKDSVETMPQTGVPNWVESPAPGYVVGIAPIVNEDKAAAQAVALKQAEQALAQRINEAVMEQILAEQARWNIVSGSLEAQLRESVRNALTLNALYDANLEQTFVNASATEMAVLVSANTTMQRDKLMERLQELDQQLPDYQHATYRGSELNQLMSLIPVLPTLEERALVKATLEQLFGEVPELQYERMAFMMDRQITTLFDGFIIGVDALTAEAERFEPGLVMALKAQGLNISARRPSLILKYFIEQDKQENSVTLLSDIELINRDSTRFATLSHEVTVEGSSHEEAKQEGLANLAEAITAVILDEVLNTIRQVNEVKYSR